jgi:ferric-dicitrate binding protein FerR (iron transport regulator)
VDAAPLLAWPRDTLAFRDAPLAEAEAELERWLGIDVEVADSALLARRLTATVDRTRATEALDAIAEGLGARYEREGDRVVLRTR